MILWNEDIKSLEDAHILIDGITEKNKYEIKKQEAFFLLC